MLREALIIVNCEGGNQSNHGPPDQGVSMLLEFQDCFDRIKKGVSHCLSELISQFRIMPSAIIQPFQHAEEVPDM